MNPWRYQDCTTKEMVRFFLIVLGIFFLFSFFLIIDKIIRFFDFIKPRRRIASKREILEWNKLKQ
jgi:hypothetical protein